MSKSLKVSLSLTIIIGLLFTSISYAAAPTTSSDIAAPTLLLKLIGVVSQAEDSASFTLTTETSAVYTLIGNTAGLEKCLGEKITVEGYIVSRDPRIMSPVADSNTLYVLNYSLYPISTPSPKPSPIVKPSPSPVPTTPVYTKIAGKLTLTDNAIYKYALTTKTNIRYFLTGKTDGMENYINQMVVAVGYIQTMSPTASALTKNSIRTIIINRYVFVVTDYYPVLMPSPTVKPTPSPVPSPTIVPIPSPPVNMKIAGKLDLTNIATYKYALTTEAGIKYLLTGKTDGMENYIGQRIVAVGYLKPVVIAEGGSTNTSIISGLVFEVVEYYPIQLPSPTVKPTPSPVPSPTIVPIPSPPANMKITGKLVQADNANYKYALITETNIKYLLTGKTDGMESYIGQKIIAVGYLKPVMTYTNAKTTIIVNRLIFVVVEYYPVKLPSPKPLPTVEPEPTMEPTPTIEPTIEPKPSSEPTIEPSPTEEPKPTPEPTIDPSPVTDQPQATDPSTNSNNAITGKPNIILKYNPYIKEIN